MASSSSTPCAACHHTRRRCTKDCVFAPHFPQDQLQKFLSLHKVFGASNVAKLLSELPFDQRNDAVTSLVFEAELQLKDPVYGPAGLVSYLQQHLKQVQDQLAKSSEELASYVGPDQVIQMQQQRQQLFEARQLEAVNAVTREQEELFRAYGRGGSNSGFDSVPTGSVTVAGSNQLGSGGTAATGVSTSLALGGNFVDDNYRTDQQNQPQVGSGFDSVPTGSVTVAGFNQLGSGGTNVTGVSTSLALGGDYNYRTDQRLHHQRQEEHGSQLFMPTESSQPLPFQLPKTGIFFPTQSSQMLPPQTRETPVFMPTQSSQPLPFQPQERQMFTPPQSSQSRLFRPKARRMFTPPQSSQSLPFQPQERQMFFPTQPSHSLPPQMRETQVFMPTQSSHSPPHQTQETRIFFPTQPSQMLPRQTQETQMFTPTQSSQSIPHQTQVRQMFKPTQSSLSMLLETQDTQTQPNSESEGGRRPWLITKKLEFKK